VGDGSSRLGYTDRSKHRGGKYGKGWVTAVTPRSSDLHVVGIQHLLNNNNCAWEKYGGSHAASHHTVNKPR